ncbi:MULTISPECIES: hypothetical protein [Pseudomonas]|uniref:hypothetical protein n=1 Tax=Pseudomonas TaxID=286 RepID=UPI00089DAF47|nr:MULTISPECIES: hypothetical protein [Pseudomonas]MBS5839672.1 hypothetical protein [Pseudomonas sp.]NMZ99645.1 hypothetical protein [Pseudomonas lundensis]
MSVYRYMIAYAPKIEYKEALEQSRALIHAFVKDREHLRVDEQRGDEDLTKFILQDTQEADVGSLIVYRNSVIFILVGPVAEKDNWRMEIDAVDLMEEAFPDSRLL